MNSYRKRILYPVFIVLILSAVPLFLTVNPDSDSPFQKLLDQIQNEKSIEPFQQSAWQWIEFQKTGLGPIPNLPAEEAIANYYFRLGEAILSRKDFTYLESALNAYEKSIRWFPRLRHGWPYYQMGNVLEKLNRPQAAREQYRLVERYDYGLLALLAGYQAARITVQLKDQPVSAYDLYTYLRFAAGNVLQDILPFGEITIQGGDEALYLQGLLEWAKNQKSAAVKRMGEYLKQRPSDPSAQYYYDRFSESAMKPIYPRDGILTTSCFAPRVYRNQNFLLSDDNHIRADLYISDPTHCELAITAQCENPESAPFELHFILNDKIRSVQTSNESNPRFSAQFYPVQEVNHLELYIRGLKEASDPVSPPPYLILHELRAMRSAAEKSS